MFNNTTIVGDIEIDDAVSPASGGTGALEGAHEKFMAIANAWRDLDVKMFEAIKNVGNNLYTGIADALQSNKVSEAIKKFGNNLYTANALEPGTALGVAGAPDPPIHDGKNPRSLAMTADWSPSIAI
jgi:hypothetical protein